MKKLLLFATIIFFAYASVIATAYHVGPGKTYLSISAVPLESLQAGDSVYIYFRGEPYRDKFVIGGIGTQTNPIVFSGVLSNTGRRPIIDGKDAVTRTELNYWSEGRGIIKIGGTSKPADTATWIVVENLEIQNALPAYTYKDDAGKNQTYSKNAAAVFIEKGENITIRNCKIHNCGNGLFSAHAAKNVTVEYCHIYDNGIEGSIYEHNSYTESDGIIFQFNKYGRLRKNCGGNNLKDRSVGTIIRYNWIEGGNRQLDLVETDYTEFSSQSRYNSTYVYNNVLVEFDNEGNRQMCHYGGDGDNTNMYRKGTLYFYNNTVVSYRPGRSTLFRLSTAEEKADVRNNVIYALGGGKNLELRSNKGTIDLRNNWINSDWVDSFDPGTGSVNDVSGNITGDTPGFIHLGNLNFNIATGSKLIANSTAIHNSVATELHPKFKFMSGTPTFNVRGEIADIGAFSYKSISITSTANPANAGAIYGTGSFDLNDSVRLEAIPANAYRFVNWTEGGNEVTKEEVYSFKASQSRAFVANFEATSRATEKIDMNALKIYPNPNNGHFIVESDTEQILNIEIRDINGRMVYSEEYRNYEGTKEFNINNLNDGIYFLILQGMNSRQVYKLIITNS